MLSMEGELYDYKVVKNIAFFVHSVAPLVIHAKRFMHLI